MAQERKSANAMTSYPLIEGYKLFQELGKGGFSVVYAGHPDGEESKLIACKIPHPKPEKKLELMRWKRGMKSYVNEVKILLELKKLGCPNIIKLINCVVSEGELKAIIFELCTNGDLVSYINHKCYEKFFKGQDVNVRNRGIFKNFQDALIFMHHHGYVHGDVKPENILIFPIKENEETKIIAKLCDFGGASRVSESGFTTCLFYSYEYKAPEIDGLNMNHTCKVDVWSFGKIVDIMYPDSALSRACLIEDVELRPNMEEVDIEALLEV